VGIYSVSATATPSGGLTTHSGTVVVLVDRAIRRIILLRPSNAVRQRFDTPAGETSALIRPSPINGGSDVVEVQGPARMADNIAVVSLSESWS
jgi:hypothetical protein